MTITNQPSTELQIGKQTRIMKDAIEQPTNEWKEEAAIFPQNQSNEKLFTSILFQFQSL